MLRYSTHPETGVLLIFPRAKMSFPLAFSIAVCQYIDMVCINCFHEKTRVTNSRRHKKYARTWRRRHCESCHLDFTTYEEPSCADMLIDKNGNTTLFNLGKLILSISRSFQHNPQAAQYDCLPLAQTVQRQLILTHANNNPIASADIATIAHQTLHRYDPVAALQYAAQHQLIVSQRRVGRPSTAYAQPSLDPEA